ncbi:MAG: MBL fold metallo-hydrolase [Bacteroidota bacterium]
MGLIQAIRKDDELIEEIRSGWADPDRFELWWLGQSGYLLRWNGRHVLIDPYLSDSLTEKYAQTEKPHVRMSEQVLAPEQLDFIDIVTSSHNHTDHLDAHTLKPVLERNAGIQFVIPEANRDFVANRVGCDPAFPIGLSKGTKVDIKGITVHGIPAAHNKLDTDEAGNYKCMGYVFEFGAFAIYHSGDTLWHEEIIDALEPFEIDLAILPINGNKPERRVAGNLNPQEAVAFAQRIGAKMVIPCHYHMFEFNTEDPAVFEREATQAGQAYQVLELGGRFRWG